MSKPIWAAIILAMGASVAVAQSTQPQAANVAPKEKAPAETKKSISVKAEDQEILSASSKSSASPLLQGRTFSTAIADNSYFIEEAFNQERGVVQHISNFAFLRNDSFVYAFTQEWPAPDERHQLSYTIPVASLSTSPRENGFGDILINYRFGAVQEAHVAFAPRVSLVLPTGSNDRGLGDGSAGVQFNLPVSHRIHENWIYHLNAGGTFLPRARSLTLGGPVRRNLQSYNLGGSLIWLARPNFNAMLETFANFDHSIDAVGGKTRDTEVFMSPGVRWAINVGDLQIVPGFAVPIRLNNGASARGVFFYLSFEHPFGRRAPKP